MLERAAGAAAAVDPGARRVSAPTSDGVPALAALVVELQEAGLAVEDIGVRRPTLDDVFLTLTGAPSATGPEPAAVPEPEGALR
jgi:ABC-2 type transport system ATP-binding protein